MPRIARVVAVGYPHHITQRGNYRQDIFENDADRHLYLSLIKSESLRHGLEILA
jgi:putative transposase